MVIYIATMVRDGSIHLFAVICGMAGGHKVGSRDDFEMWKLTVQWEWNDHDTPGHPNILLCSECSDDKCQLCNNPPWYVWRA